MPTNYNPTGMATGIRYPRGRQQNYYATIVDQFTPVYGGGAFGSGFSGRQGSGMVSATGFGGATRQDVAADPRYQQVQQDEAKRQYQALIDQIKFYEQTMRKSGYEPTAAYANQQIQQYLAPKGFVFGPKAELETLGTGVKKSELRKLKAEAQKAQLAAEPEKVKLGLQQQRSEAELRDARKLAMEEKTKMGWQNANLRKAAADAKQRGDEDTEARIAQYDTLIEEMSAEERAIALKPEYLNAVRNGTAPEIVAQVVKDAVATAAKAKAELANAKAKVAAIARRAVIDLADYRLRRTSRATMERKYQDLVAKRDGMAAAVAELGAAATAENKAVLAQLNAQVESYKQALEAEPATAQSVGMVGTGRAEAPTISTQEEVDALPSGTVFIYSEDGQTYRKD